MKKCKNCNVKYPDEKKFCKTCGEPLIEIQEFDLEKVAQKAILDGKIWFKRIIKFLVGLIALGVVSYAVYYFILRNDPIKDARKLASANCHYLEKRNDEYFKITQTFLASFNGYNFKNKHDAETKINDLLRPANHELLDSQIELKRKIQKVIEEKYSYANYKKAIIFISAIDSITKKCISNTDKYLSSIEKFNKKIDEIIETEPYQQILKSAIEQQIQGVQDPTALPTFPQEIKKP